MNIFEIFGVIGLLLVSAGIVLKKRRKEDILYLLGGVCLEIYSVHIHENIFIILQAVFIVSALYDLITTKK